MPLTDSILAEKKSNDVDPFDAFLSGQAEPIQPQQEFVEDEYGFPTIDDEKQEAVVENFTPFGAGVEIDGDLNSVIDQLEGNVLDEMEMHARDTILGQALPDQTEYERQSTERSGIASMQRGSAVGNFALGTAIGLVGDLPAELALAATTGGVANLARRGATAARASTKFTAMANRLRIMGGADDAIRAMDDMARASSALSKTFMFGPEGRVADNAIKRFAAESLGAGVSEAVASTAIGADSDEVAQRILGGLALGGVMAEGMYRLAGGVKAVSGMLAQKGYSPEVIAKVEGELEARGDHLVEPKTERLDTDQAQATIKGQEANLSGITKAADDGVPSRLTTEQMGEVEILPTRTDMGVVRNATQDALRDVGVDLHFVKPLGESGADGITIGKQVFIDSAVNDADFARLTGHELLHTSINKMDPEARRVTLDKMREIAERSDIDTAGLTNEKLIEEFFAVGGGRRGQDIIDTLTADLSKTESGKNALNQFYDQVKDFIVKLADKVKFYTSDASTKEIDDYAEELVRNTIGSKKLDFVADSGDVKASEKIPQQAQPKTASLESETDRVIMNDVLANDETAYVSSLTDEKFPEVQAIGYKASVDGNKRSRVDLKENVVDIKSYGSKSKYIKEALLGIQSMGQQVITNIREMGFKSVADAMDEGIKKEAILSNQINDGRAVTYDELGITSDVVADQNSTDIRPFDIAGQEAQLTQSAYARLIGYTRSQTSMGKSKGNNMGVDDNGFGMTSPAHNLSTGGFIDAKGNKIDLTADEVKAMADQQYDFDNVLEAAKKDYRTSGNLADWSSAQQGGNRITDPTDLDYLPKHVVEKGVSTTGRLTEFDNGDAGTWVARESNKQPIDLQTSRPSVLAESARMADNSAKMLGYETTVKQSKAGLFKSPPMNTGRYANEFLLSDDAPKIMKDAYEKELAKSGDVDKAIAAGLKKGNIKLKSGKRLGYTGEARDDGSILIFQEIPDLDTEITAKLGSGASKKIQQRIDATIETSRSDDILGFAASQAMRMKRISTLGLNTTPIIQVFSMPYAGIRVVNRLGKKVAEHFKPAAMMGSLKDISTNKALRADVEAKAMEFIPMYKNRIDSGNMNQEFAELGGGTKEKSQLKERWNELKKTTGVKGRFNAFLSAMEESLVPISKVDRLAILGEVNQIFKAAKGMGLEEGSEKWAIEVNKMFSEVLTTQPTSWSAFKNTPQLSQGPVVRTLSMFTGATGPIFGMAQEAYTKILMGDAKMARELLPAMMMSVAGVAAVGVGAGEAKKAVFQTEKDRAAINKKFGGPMSEFVTRAIGSTVGTVPIFGQLASGAASQVITGNSFDSQVPLLQMGNDAVKAVGKMSDFEVGQATYLFLKNTTPYAVSRGFRRLDKEVTD